MEDKVKFNPIRDIILDNILNKANSLKISIITVVYNNKETIRDAIESIQSQTYDNIEHIIIDGNSTDGTVNIVNSYGDKIAKFVSERDDGLYDAMNKGIELATGDVVGILNSDDVYFDDKVIERVMDEFVSKNVQSVFADLDFVDQYDIDKVVRKWRLSPYVPGSFAKGWHPAHPSFFVKKEVYDKYGMFDLELAISADFELMLRFLEKHHISTSYLPQVLVKMRMGGESTSSLKNTLLANKNVRKAFRKNGIKVSKFYTPKRLAIKALKRIAKL